MGRSDSLQGMPAASAVPMRLLLIGGLLLALLVLHHQTFASMVRSWLGDSTYTHGFAIPLIALFFAWQRREDAAAADTRVWWPGFVLIAGLSGLWTVATIVNVQVVAQLASIGLISAVVLTLAGPPVAAVLALPLLYLLFAVPFGEGIVPLLMEWTADFTVGALHLVGIPVIRDGMHFSIPSGNFEVAKACSGVRYLLASAAAGVAFAFLTYDSGKKRLVFILAALVVPIVANGLRAFGIVLIAHYSDLALATGIDHFIYGWVFFGVIILLLFIVGARYADSLPDSGASGVAGARRVLPDSSDGPTPLVGAGILAIVLIAAGPALIQYRSVSVPDPALALPDISGPTSEWEGPSPPDEAWRLGYRGAADELAAAYRHGQSGRTVELRLAGYGLQQQGAELINATNRVVDGDEWQIQNLGRTASPVGSMPGVRVVRARHGSDSYLIWYWYQQGEQQTTSNYKAKLLEALAIARPSAASIVAIGAREAGGNTEEVLRTFLRDVDDSLQRCAAGAAVGDNDCTLPESPVYRISD
ncbi:exosortase A [Lentisalinibacter salinarum]|uniref:exosortase A n=1 Tax=Lentisalinibacter salinarum TaxID=2992239 RepID=UPI00386EFE3E